MALATALRRLSDARLRRLCGRTAAGLTAGARLPAQRSFTAGTHALRSDDKVTVHFVNRDGDKITVKGSPGDSLLDVVINEDLDFDGYGACEGTLACSTCHLIFDEDTYKKLGAVTDEELDMLDLAYGLTDTSRLGCQICLSKSLDGIMARIPESVADIRQSTDGSV
ncbi:adrenodoxin, mitochondrial [Solea senegalensis]|uniref:Adrenodoxin, mitochondrial n=1 Tax=Solea senegalensis TaxID=28829 RepID=A0AAV6RDX4_SOLSE|nr:adrenodoxin-like [Solea senegalensis]KAG7502665.1 adrenodoxin, mitochondrial [Solea senegalensis]